MSIQGSFGISKISYQKIFNLQKSILSVENQERVVHARKKLVNVRLVRNVINQEIVDACTVALFRF